MANNVIPMKKTEAGAAEPATEPATKPGIALGTLLLLGGGGLALWFLWERNQAEKRAEEALIRAEAKAEIAAARAPTMYDPSTYRSPYPRW